MYFFYKKKPWFYKKKKKINKSKFQTHLIFG
jgi:hypothetical protein